MPIDFVKLQVFNTAVSNFVNNLKLDFETTYNLDTYEINDKKRKVAKYKNLEITIIADKYIYIQGSLHIFWKGHNGGLFTFKELVKAITELERLLNFSANNAKITQLEYGVNIHPPIDSVFFLNHIIAFKGKPINRSKIGVTAELTEYNLKLYSKSEQIKSKRIFLNKDTLRCEIHISKSQKLKSNDIQYLSDLYCFYKIKSLVAPLKTALKGLIFCIPNNTIINNHWDKKFLLEKCNAIYWLEFREETNRINNRVKYHRTLKKYNDLIEKYNSNQYQKVKKIIIKKFNHLLKN